MTQTVKAREILQRGAANLPAGVLKFLVENEAEVQKLHDGLEAYCADARAAMKALDVRLDAFDSLDAALADLATREADYAARVGTLAAGEAKAQRQVEMLTDLSAVFQHMDDAEPGAFDRAAEAFARKW